MIRHILNNSWKAAEEGFALLIAVTAVAILFMIGAGLLSASAVDRKISLNSTKASKALYLAEAGRNYAVARLMESTDYRVSRQDYTLDGVSFNLSVTSPTARRFALTSKGSAENVERTVIAQAVYTSPIFNDLITSFGSSGQNTVGADAVIAGDMMSNQSVSFGANPLVEGWVFGNQGISGPGSGNIFHQVSNAGIPVASPKQPDYPEKSRPAWTAGWYLAEGLGNPALINGDVYNLNQFATDHYFHVSGDVTLGDGIELSGKTIVVDGNVSIGQGAVFSDTTIKSAAMELGGGGRYANSNLVAKTSVSIALGDGTAFSGIIFSGGSLTVEDELEVTGDTVLSAEGNLVMGQGVEGGNSALAVYSGGAVSIARKLAFLGQVTLLSGGKIVFEPTAHVQVGTGLIYSSGSQDLGQVLSAANLLVSSGGNVVLQGSAGPEERQVNGQVFSRGSITIGNGFQTVAGDRLALVAGGDITLGLNARLAGIVYSYSGNVTAGAGLDFTGSLYGAGFRIGDEARMVFDRQVIEGVSFSGISAGTGGISITSWSEQ